MSVSRVVRSKSVEYKISFIQKRREVYIYIGSQWAGRIIHSTKDPLHKAPGYGVYLQLPGCWGPVAKETTLSDAKIEAALAVRRWLATLNDEPMDAEERPERVTEGRVTRTRQTAAEEEIAPARIRRTR